MPLLRTLACLALVPLPFALLRIGPPAGGKGAAGPATQAQTSPAAQFASLRWLEGRWLGSGGQYPAFYEEYRFLNDSTIEQREIADSTFTRVNTRRRIALRGGKIGTLNAEDQFITTIDVVADTARFTSNRGRAYRFVHTGEGAWRAELGSVTYVMKRIGR